MKQVVDTQELTYKELSEHPKIIAELLGAGSRVSLNLEKDGERIVVRKKIHRPEFIELMEKVDTEVEKKRKKGYTREQAIDNFEKNRTQIIEKMYG